MKGILLDGRNFEILIPRGENYSRAMRKYNQQNELDTSIFLMEELVLIDGERKDIAFFKELFCDDFMVIVESLGEMITRIKL